MNVTPIDCIDHTAKNYADARALLAARVQKHNEECEDITRRLLPGIRTAAIAAAQAQAELKDFIEANPDLFVRPRTMTLHGVKVGFQKGKGRITYADAAKVCELIRKHLPDETAALIKVTEVPLKDGLLNLDIAMLKKLGCTVEDSGDEIIIKDSTGEIDKIVARLLVEAAKPNEGGQS